MGRYGYSSDTKEASWCNGSTLALAQNAGDVDLIPALSTVLPIIVTPTTQVAVIMILYALGAVWLLNPPCACM